MSSDGTWPSAAVSTATGVRRSLMDETLQSISSSGRFATSLADLYVNPKASAGALGNSFASDALGAITAGDLVLCKLLIEKFPHRRRQDPFHQWARGGK